MRADGIIGRYAIADAVAAYNYIEPTLTEDERLRPFKEARERRKAVAKNSEQS